MEIALSSLSNPLNLEDYHKEGDDDRFLKHF